MSNGNWRLSEESLQLALEEAAAKAVLPQRFAEPSRLVVRAPRSGRRWLRAAVAVVAAAAVLGLGLSTPIGKALVHEVSERLGWGTVDPRTWEEYIESVQPPPIVPPPAPDIDLTLVEGKVPLFFLPPTEGVTPHRERAYHPTLVVDGQAEGDSTVLHYEQNYKLASGLEVIVNQRIIAGTVQFQFPPDTQAITINGYTAYLITSHVGWDKSGKQIISHYPSITMLVPISGSTDRLSVWVDIPEGETEADVQTALDFARQLVKPENLRVPEASTENGA